jgi:hypothetical protein
MSSGIPLLRIVETDDGEAKHVLEDMGLGLERDIVNTELKSATCCAYTCRKVTVKVPALISYTIKLIL